MLSTTAIGEFIRERRATLKLTQKELAHLLAKQGFEYSIQTVGHWESGRVAVPLQGAQGERFLSALASALEVSTLKILDVSGYLNSMDLKFDVETYEFAKLIERVTPAQRKIVIQLLEELVGNH